MKRNVLIDGHLVGEDEPVYIIAEACDNHLGDIKIAREMVRLAKLAGADAIKFQHHLPDEEMLPNVPASVNYNMPLYDFLKKHALHIEQHVELKEYCQNVGIQYLCTPFSLKAAEELHKIGLEAFKIGSGEMTDIPTLKKIAEFGRPMIVSTGMSTVDEIDRTYKILTDMKVPLILMHCVSEYPALYEDVNLGFIGEMIKRYDKAVIGHSDHTEDLYTCYAAVAMGAKVIEKHVITDKKLPGPDKAVSIDFYELAGLVDGIRKIEAASGVNRKVHKREFDIRAWAARSIVALCDIQPSEVITKDKIWSKRPGTGIPAHLMDKLIGMQAKRRIKKNSMISKDDLVGGEELQY
ncbi:MAG TPA: N-acetylneuraminate synthase family protein [Candidatus Omnitrophota bacterium]|nr:N-acetylneuraminate synthase family protein [Candidatus Omnitrophota bacterium]